METMKRIVLILLVIIFVSLLIFQFVHAEIYKWVDEKGTVHFTEDPETIPEKYRDTAKSRTTEEDLMTPEERARQRKSYEEEVRERLKREKKEYDLKETEKRVKEMEDRARKQKEEQVREMEDQARKEREKGKCEIVGYSQYDEVKDIQADSSARGVLDIWTSKQTCVDIVI